MKKIILTIMMIFSSNLFASEQNEKDKRDFYVSEIKRLNFTVRKLVIDDLFLCTSKDRCIKIVCTDFMTISLCEIQELESKINGQTCRKKCQDEYHDCADKLLNIKGTETALQKCSETLYSCREKC